MKILKTLVIILTIIFLYCDNSYSKSLYSSYISEGMNFYKLGDYDKAIENFQSAIELNPNDPLPHRMIGLCNYRKDSLTEALKYLCISMTLEEEDNLITLSIIGNIYYKQKKYNNALLVYDKLNSLTNSAFISYRLIGLLEKFGKLEEATIVGEKFLSSPNWNEFDEKTFKSKLRSIYIKLANKYKKEGNKEKYERCLEKARNI